MSPSSPFYISEADAPAKRAALEAGLLLFSRNGVDGVTIRDISKHTGFSNPALFRHFPSKNALAVSLYVVCYRRLLMTFKDGARRDGVQGALAASLTLIDEAPEAVHYVLENLRRFFAHLPEELRNTSILGEARRLILAEQQASRVARHADADLAAALLLGALGQIARMHHFGELVRRPIALAGPLWKLIHDGIGN